MYASKLLALIAIAAAPVWGHGKVTAASGDLGGKGTGLGILGGAANANSQADVTVFKQATGLGATQGGAIVLATAFAAMLKLTGNTIPQVSAAAGVVTMTFHQVNGDGAGPISCSVSADGTGAAFTPMTVTTDVPGNNGNSGAANTDFPLVAAIPAGTTCTGTIGTTTNVCLVKCANPSGPFGGTVPVQQVAGGAAAAAAGNAQAAGGAQAAAGNAQAAGGKKNNVGGVAARARAYMQM